MITKDDITIINMDWKDRKNKIFNIKYRIRTQEDSLDISIDKETKKVTILSDGFIVGLPKEASQTIMLMIVDKAMENNRSN